MRIPALVIVTLLAGSLCCAEETTPPPAEPPPTAEAMQASIAELSAKLETSKAEIAAIKEAIAADPAIVELRRAAAVAREDYDTARAEDEVLAGARQAEIDARAAYDQALATATAEDEGGKTLLADEVGLADDAFDIDLQRQLLRVKIDLDRRRLERKDAELKALRAKRDAAREAREEAEKEDPALVAAREAAEVAEKALDELLDTPEIKAAREAREAARDAYEKLRDEHATNLAWRQAEADYRQLLDEKSKVDEAIVALRATDDQAKVDLESIDERRDAVRDGLEEVRRGLRENNETVVTASTAYEEAKTKAREAEDQPALVALAQARKDADKAYAEAVKAAEVAHETLPGLVAAVAEAEQAIDGLRGDLKALEIAEKVKPVDVDPTTLVPGLVCSVYTVTDDHENFTALQPTRVVKAAAVDLSLQPGEEDFALAFDGVLKIETEGIYDLALNSDDGSTLSLSGYRVIDNGGMHGTTRVSQKVKLAPGIYPLRITYYQGSGGAELELTMAVGDAEPAAIPAGMLLSRPADQAKLTPAEPAEEKPEAAAPPAE